MKLQWNQIDWKKAEELVNRLQIRIVKATLEKKWRLVKRLQYLMTNSFYAKALAVKRVATNKGKNTPGIDGAVWKNNEEKVKAILNLECQTYHAKPLRRIYIEKFGKKEKRGTSFLMVSRMAGNRQNRRKIASFSRGCDTFTQRVKPQRPKRE